MKTIDAKGKMCPVPLIMTKKALSEIQDNELLEVIIDNETSAKNVSRFCQDNGMQVKTERTGNIIHLVVSKTGVIVENIPVEEYCALEAPLSSKMVIAFQRNKLGDGADELGILLMKAFINTLPEITVRPGSLVFLNSGVFLTLRDSPVLDALKTLEQNHSEILVCGTCLDYYAKKEELAVGTVSNMFDILERLSKAGHIVYP
ncbi:MAG: sulfurtransferase-like selenium metabolism protein YedF [Bacteroidales bacterium]|nr:sulfurtransferase-like selenium metabolism protein YedF [Bacteroidales bacterium]